MTAVVHDVHAVDDGSRSTPSVREIELLTVVYCVWNVDRNAVKIGFTSNPDVRFRQLKTACCDRLVFWAQFPGGRITESVWHEALTNCELRMQGEWFDASDGVILKGFLETALKQGGKTSL